MKSKIYFLYLLVVKQKLYKKFHKALTLVVETLKPCGVKANRIYKMTNTQKFAKQELDILAATVPDAIVTPFAKEILALCEAFGKSGQSGGSAPYTASVIAQAVKKLCLQEPICDVTGHNLHYIEDGFGECYYTVLKDPKQLDKVFKYYNKK